MAPTRRRQSEEASPGRGEPEVERSPKAHRLSNGSRASTSGSTPGGSPVTDMHEEANEQEEEEEEEEAEPAAPKGKEKRRAIPDDDDNEEEEEEEEKEEHIVENEAAEMAEKARKMEEMCRQQEEEDRLLGADDVGEADGHERGAAGEENEGLPPPRRKKGRRTAGLSADQKVKESEAGVVLKVYVENFMCHRKLTVSLCKQLNFINGRNGSGKSAILAALQICLGARANLTHRAKKMSDFIRHGWGAVLEVTLLNNEQGYKYETYGDSITIRRTIRQPSGGGFTLLGHDGKSKSTDRAELVRMLDMLSIQVDNPCAVLDQENSKNFLQGSDSEKYAFFMKATDLDRILADNEATGRSISKMRTGHDDAVAMLPRYQKIVGQKKLELKEYQALDVLLTKIKSLKDQKVWAHVNEAEERVAIADQEVKAKNVDIDKINRKTTQLEEQIAVISAGKEKIKERYDAGVAEIQRLKKVVIEKGEELVVAQTPLLDLKGQLSILEGEKREKMAAKKSISRKVKAARENAKRKASDQREKDLLDSMQRTEESLANVIRMREGMGGDEQILRLRQALNHAKDGAAKAKEDYQRSAQELRALKDELRTLETERFNPLTAIAPFMPVLVNRIAQEASQFQSPPVGPIGASIQLKEDCKQFRVCIEGHLSKTLDNFVVSCQQDKTKLMALMKQVRGRQRWRFLPAVIVQALQSRYQPPPNPTGYLQIMQAINVTNDQAFNSLVDQCGIEKRCLFASKEEAEARCLVGASGRYQHMPHGMFEAYYPSLGGKSCSKFNVSDGNLQTRMNAVNVQRHKSVLGVDEGTQKEEVRMQVQLAEAALEQVRAVAEEGVSKVKAAEASLGQEDAQRNGLGQQERQLEREKNKLSTELMALQAKKNDDATEPTEELERDLEVTTEELESITKELATMEGSIREITAQVEPVKQSKSAAKRAHKEATDAAETIRDELENGDQRENKYQLRVNRLQAALAETTEQRDKLSGCADLETQNLAEDIEKASTCMRYRRKDWDGSRVETRLSVQQLKQKVKVSEERYEKDRAEKKIKSKSVDEVNAQMINAVKVYHEKESLADRLDKNMEMLSAERLERSRKWTEMRRHVESNTSRLFDQYLQKKGASGEVNFDNANCTLGLTYQKNSGDDSSQCDDVKLLSGGERSFATLALLLALGKSIEGPFRVMDEFDIFMDAMSRNVAVQEVIDYAKEDRLRQYILITPQDLSSVTPSDTCKIIKMKSPRKGDHNQQTLEESFGGGAS